MEKRGATGSTTFWFENQFKILVAMVSVVKSRGFKEIVVLTSKLKNGATFNTNFQFRG
jgi:hypothetical protein